MPIRKIVKIDAKSHPGQQQAAARKAQNRDRARQDRAQQAEARGVNTTQLAQQESENFRQMSAGASESDISRPANGNRRRVHLF